MSMPLWVSVLLVVLLILGALFLIPAGGFFVFPLLGLVLVAVVTGLAVAAKRRMSTRPPSPQPPKD